MNRCTMFRTAATSLSVVAGALFTLGVAADRVDVANDFYCFGIAVVIAVATCLVLMTLEQTVGRVVSREMARSRGFLATSVAKALADELDARYVPDHIGTLTPVD